MLPVVIFEGVDKSGKSTLVAEFNKATNYKYLVLDRFLISSLVYDEAFERDGSRYYEELCRAFGKLDDVAFIVVLCECSVEDNRRRLFEAGEYLPSKLGNVGQMMDSFKSQVRRRCKLNAGGFVSDYLVVNTSEMPVNFIVQLVKDEVEAVENKNLVFKG